MVVHADVWQWYIGMYSEAIHEKPKIELVHVFPILLSRGGDLLGDLHGNSIASKLDGAMEWKCVDGNGILNLEQDVLAHPLGQT
jgi:hypothetical protein